MHVPREREREDYYFLHNNPDIVVVYMKQIILPEDVVLGGWAILCSLLNLIGQLSQGRLTWKLHKSLEDPLLRNKALLACNLQPKVWFALKLKAHMLVVVKMS